MLSNTHKKHIRSAIVTFITTFFIILGSELHYHLPITWDMNAMVGISMVCFRGALKIAFEAWLGSNDNI